MNELRVYFHRKVLWLKDYMAPHMHHLSPINQIKWMAIKRLNKVFGNLLMN